MHPQILGRPIDHCHSVYLIDNNLLFEGHSTPELNKHYGLDTSLMSEIETGESHTPEFYERARKVLQNQLGFSGNSQLEHITDADCDIVRWACKVVATRAAKLSGIAVAAVVRKTGADKKEGPIEIGVDGR